MVVDPWIGSSIIRIMSERFSHLDHFPPQETKKERSQRQRKIRKLATKFREELRNSQSFTWFGMYETQDELDRTRRVFMVAEKPENPEFLPHSDHNDIFTDLASIAMPEVFYDMYFLKDQPTNPNEISLKSIAERYSTDAHEAKVRKLYEESLDSNS